MTHHKINSIAGHHIFRIMEVAGVEEWSKLKGKNVRFKKGPHINSRIVGIGHILRDDWFMLQEATNETD